MKTQNQAQLGDRARDVISNFEGIVVATTDWLYGCRRITLAPEKVQADGKLGDNLTFDVDQIHVIVREAVKVPGPAVAVSTGGPDRHEERR